MPTPVGTKGYSGNPNGRPKVTNSLSDVLRRKLEELDESGVPRKELIAEKLMTLAQGASKDEVVVKAIKDIFDRLEGSPKQSIEAEISDLRPIVFDNSLGKLVSKELPDDSKP